MYIDVVFDGPPSHKSGRFIEVELADGRSCNVGVWVERQDGYWCLRLTPKDLQDAIDLEPRDLAGWEGGFAPNH